MAGWNEKWRRDAGLEESILDPLRSLKVLFGAGYLRMSLRSSSQRVGSKVIVM